MTAAPAGRQHFRKDTNMIKALFVILAILIFGFLIFIHELGHYLSARLFGVKIHEFAIGMGPKLITYESKKSGILYSLRAFPIGGYVSMLGEQEEVPAAGGIADELPAGTEPPVLSGTDHAGGVLPGERALPAEPDPRCLAAKPAWQRLIVHSAGALMNLLLGFIIMIIIACTTQLGSTEIAKFEVQEGTVSSADSGLEVGDVILEIAGNRVHISDQLYYEVMRNVTEVGQAIPVTVRRGDEELTLSVVFPTIEESGQVFGNADFIVWAEDYRPGTHSYPFKTVVKHAFYKCTYVVNMVWESLVDLVTGRYTLQAVSGPIGTIDAISDSAQSAKDGTLLYTLGFLGAIITINLGVFNLLPIPALDGSHVLCSLVELVSRKKVPGRLVTAFDTVGLIVLLGLVAIISLKDVFVIFRR